MLMLPAKEFEPALLPVKVPVSTSLPVLFIEETVIPPAVRDLVRFSDPANDEEPAPVPWNESAVTDLVTVTDLEIFKLPENEFDPE